MSHRGNTQGAVQCGIDKSNLINGKCELIKGGAGRYETSWCETTSKNTCRLTEAAKLGRNEVRKAMRTVSDDDGYRQDARGNDRRSRRSDRHDDEYHHWRHQRRMPRRRRGYGEDAYYNISSMDLQRLSTRGSSADAPSPPPVATDDVPATVPTAVETVPRSTKNDGVTVSKNVMDSSAQTFGTGETPVPDTTTENDKWRQHQLDLENIRSNREVLRDAEVEKIRQATVEKELELEKLRQQGLQHMQSGMMWQRVSDADVAAPPADAGRAASSTEAQLKSEEQRRGDDKAQREFMKKQQEVQLKHEMEIARMNNPNLRPERHWADPRGYIPGYGQSAAEEAHARARDLVLLGQGVDQQGGGTVGAAIGATVGGATGALLSGSLGGAAAAAAGGRVGRAIGSTLGKGVGTSTVGGVTGGAALGGAVGGAVGGAAGFLSSGPVGSAVGSAVGGTVGGVIGSAVGGGQPVVQSGVHGVVGAQPQVIVQPVVVQPPQQQDIDPALGRRLDAMEQSLQNLATLQQSNIITQQSNMLAQQSNDLARLWERVGHEPGLAPPSGEAAVVADHNPASVVVGTSVVDTSVLDRDREEIARLSQRMAELEAELHRERQLAAQDVATEVAAVERHIRESVAEVDAVVREGVSHMMGIAQELSRGTHEQHQQGAESLRRYVDELKVEVERLAAEKIAALDGHVDELSRQMPQEDVTGLREGIQGMVSDMQGLQGQLNDLAEVHSKHTADVQEFLSPFAERLHAIEEALDVKSLKAQTEDLASLIQERVEEGIKELESHRLSAKQEAVSRGEEADRLIDGLSTVAQEATGRLKRDIQRAYDQQVDGSQQAITAVGEQLLQQLRDEAEKGVKAIQEQILGVQLSQEEKLKELTERLDVIDGVLRGKITETAYSFDTGETQKTLYIENIVEEELQREIAGLRETVEGVKEQIKREKPGTDDVATHQQIDELREMIATMEKRLDDEKAKSDVDPSTTERVASLEQTMEAMQADGANAQLAEDLRTLTKKVESHDERLWKRVSEHVAKEVEVATSPLREQMPKDTEQFGTQVAELQGKIEESLAEMGKVAKIHETMQAENKQLQELIAKITKVENRLDSMTDSETNALSQAAANLRQEFEALKEETGDNRSALEGHSDSHAGLEEHIKRLEQDFQEKTQLDDGRYQSLNVSVSELKNRVEEMQQSTKTALSLGKEMQQQLMQTNQRMDELEPRVTRTLEQTRNGFESRLAAMEERLDEMNQQMAKLESLKKEAPDFDITEPLAELRKGYAEHLQDVDARIIQLKTESSESDDTRNKELLAKFVVLESDILKQIQQVNGMYSESADRLQKLEGGLERVEGDIGTLRGDVGKQIGDAVAPLQRSVEEVNESIATINNSVELIQREQRQSISRVTELEAALASIKKARAQDELDAGEVRRLHASTVAIGQEMQNMTHLLQKRSVGLESMLTEARQLQLSDQETENISAKVHALHEQYEDAMGKYGGMAAAIAELKGSFDTATDMSKRLQSLEDIYESHKKHMQELVKPIKLQQGSLLAEMQSSEAPILEYYQDIVDSITSIRLQLNELENGGALDSELANQVALNDKLVGDVLGLQKEMSEVQQQLDTFPLTIKERFKAVSDTYATQDHVGAIWKHIKNIDKTITEAVTTDVTKNMSDLISGLETTQGNLEEAHKELQTSFETIDTTKDKALGELSEKFQVKLTDLTQSIVDQYQQRIKKLDDNIKHMEEKSNGLEQSLGEAAESLKEENLKREKTMEEASEMVQEYKRIAESVKKQLSSNGKDNLDIADVFEKYEFALQEARDTISVLERKNTEALASAASAVSTIQNTTKEYYENVTALKDEVHNEYDTLSRNVEALATNVTDGRRIQQQYLKNVQETETRVKAECKDVIAKVQAIVTEGDVQRGEADKHLRKVEESMENVLQEFNKVSGKVRSEASDLRNIQDTVRNEFGNVSKSVTQLAGMVVGHGATQAKQQKDAQTYIAKIKMSEEEVMEQFRDVSKKMDALRDIATSAHQQGQTSGSSRIDAGQGETAAVPPLSLWKLTPDVDNELSSANVERSTKAAVQRNVEYADEVLASMDEILDVIHGLHELFEEAVGKIHAQSEGLKRFESADPSSLNSTEDITEIRQIAEETNNAMHKLETIYKRITDLRDEANKLFVDYKPFSETHTFSNGDDTFREIKNLDFKTSYIENAKTEVNTIVDTLSGRFEEARALSVRIDEMAEA